MVKPAQRRALAVWAKESYALSEVRACRAVGVQRSSVRYKRRRAHQDVLRRQIRELASVRVRAGYRQLHVLLRREGWPVNRKRVYRLYTEENLTLRQRRPKRHAAGGDFGSGHDESFQGDARNQGVRGDATSGKWRAG